MLIENSRESDCFPKIDSLSDFEGVKNEDTDGDFISTGNEELDVEFLDPYECFGLDDDECEARGSPYERDMFGNYRYNN